MDSYPYFTAAPQPYHFLQVGLPPTPAHTGSANSDDYSNSPPVRDQFLKVQTYSQSLLTPKQDAFDNFQNFNGFDHYANSNSLPNNKPPTPVSTHKGSIGNVGLQVYEGNNGEVNNNGNQQGSNSDDDDNMTPAQSRRKAQNRAA
jgi:AP-1-like factor